MKKIITLSILTIIVMGSCSKKSGDNPTTTETTPVDLLAKGKWNAVKVTLDKANGAQKIVLTSGFSGLALDGVTFSQPKSTSFNVYEGTFTSIKGSGVYSLQGYDPTRGATLLITFSNSSTLNYGVLTSIEVNSLVLYQTNTQQQNTLLYPNSDGSAAYYEDIFQEMTH